MQEPTIREFCPSGSSCYNCAHDLSLSLNIVRIPTFPMWCQSLETYICKPSYDKYDKSLQHSNDWPLSWPSLVLPSQSVHHHLRTLLKTVREMSENVRLFGAVNGAGIVNSHNKLFSFFACTPSNFLAPYINQMYDL